MLLNVSRAVVLCLFVVSICVANPRPGKRVSFNDNWRFHLGDVTNGQNTDDTKWRQLNLPHDWSIEGEFSEKAPAGTGGGALPGGLGWYRKTFTIDAASKGKLIFVEFDGVYRNSEVWINGHYLGKRPYGYSTFQYELTPYLVYGAKPNVIAVKVDNSQQPNSRWYSGSGIYRNVWLTELNPAGSIVGVDNGNQISHESFKASQRKAFHGMALAIVQAKQNLGRIVLKATSPNLAPASIVLNAR
jgi:hypothetical protein